MPVPAVQISSSKMAQDIFNQVNHYRESHGLTKLIWDGKIAQEAQRHSLDMARVKRISHDGFDQRWSRLRRVIFGARGIAENVAMNRNHRDPSSLAVKGWINSPGHHRNMIGDYNRTGIAVQKAPDGSYFFTQIFMKA